MIWRLREFTKKCAEKAEAFFDKIPRKVQVAVNLPLVLLMAFLLYIFLGAKTFTTEHAFRRAEKRNMIGPSRILGVEEVDTLYADQLVVAETDKGVVLFTLKDHQMSPVNNLSYQEKTGDMMIGIMPTMLSSLVPPSGDDLTVILFDGCPEAVRAELDMEVFWEDARTGEQYRYQYALSGTRTDPGYIRMDYDIQWHDYQGVWDHPENDAIRQLVIHAMDIGYRAPAGEFPATVRLYGADGGLLCTRELFLFPQEGEEQ